MNTRRILHGIGPVALAAGLCLTASALAADELPAITIGAGVVMKTNMGRSSSGAPIEKVTITHRVSYSDLDLSTRTGAAELRKRVEKTARTACKQLDELYPMDAKSAPECTKTALAEASAQVDNAIAAARREAKAD